MILNYFNNKKQINSKLTQHGGVGDGKEVAQLAFKEHIWELKIVYWTHSFQRW